MWAKKASTAIEAALLFFCVIIVIKEEKLSTKREKVCHLWTYTNPHTHTLNVMKKPCRSYDGPKWNGMEWKPKKRDRNQTKRKRVEYQQQLHTSSQISLQIHAACTCLLSLSSAPVSNWSCCTITASNTILYTNKYSIFGSAIMPIYCAE